MFAQQIDRRVTDSTGSGPDALALSEAVDRVAHPPRMSQLDGMRAIAIGMVIAQHSLLLPFGWAGVHLFFVLSGFLITRILRRSRDDKHFWAPFYLKRATRILPPLLVFFLLCSLEMSIPWKSSGWAYIFFGANIVQSLPHAKITDLTVLWSLAVEEHFYLLWPFAVRYLQRRALILLLISIVVLVPVARGMFTHHLSSWLPIYFLTPFQLDGLGAGALLAVLLEDRRWNGWLSRVALPAALLGGAIILACSRLGTYSREADSVLFNSVGYLLIVLTAAMFLAHIFLKPHASLSRLLSFAPFVFIGTISYGLYLYTSPVIHLYQRVAMAHGMDRGRINLLLGVIVTVAVSWVSFRFYESPLVSFGRVRAKALTGSSTAT